MPQQTTRAGRGAQDTTKLDVKLFVEPSISGSPAGPLDLAALIPIFHRWIQEADPEELLIDVADYRHVPGGPGVMLIGHYGHYALDAGGGRLGLLFSRRREPEEGMDTPAPFRERVRSALRAALVAAGKLQREPTLRSRQLRFRADRFLLRFNDRLLAPGAAEAEDEVRAPLEALCSGLFPQTPVTVERVGEPRERLGFLVRAAKRPAGGLAALLAQVAKEG